MATPNELQKFAEWETALTAYLYEKIATYTTSTLEKNWAKDFVDTMPPHIHATATSEIPGIIDFAFWFQSGAAVLLQLFLGSHHVTTTTFFIGDFIQLSTPQGPPNTVAWFDHGMRAPLYLRPELKNANDIKKFNQKYDVYQDWVLAKTLFPVLMTYKKFKDGFETIARHIKPAHFRFPARPGHGIPSPSLERTNAIFGTPLRRGEAYYIEPNTTKNAHGRSIVHAVYGGNTMWNVVKSGKSPFTRNPITKKNVRVLTKPNTTSQKLGKAVLATLTRHQAEKAAFALAVQKALKSKKRKRTPPTKQQCTIM